MSEHRPLPERARVAARLGRRAVIGARNLSPKVVLAWGVDRVRTRGAEASPEGAENSSLTWVTIDEHTTTVAWLHNYWSWGYGADGVELTATLIAMDGSPVASWPVPLAPDATVAIDLKDACQNHGVAVPFEGQLLLQLRHKALVAGRPVQVFGEYVRDDGEATGVHGQYGLMHHPLGQVVSFMRVEPPPARTAVVVNNAYDGPGGGRMRARLQVSSSEGETVQCDVDRLAPRESRVLWLDEEIRGLDELLAGKPGHVQIEVPCAVSRLATWVDFADGRRVINHGTIDRIFDQRLGVPASWVNSYAAASVLALADEHRDTRVLLINAWGPRVTSYEACTRLYRQDGHVVAEQRVLVGQAAVREVSLRQMAVDAGEALPFIGHAEVSLEAPDGGEAPAVVDVLVGLFDDDRLVGEVQVGGEFNNAAVPPGVATPDLRRTRVFGRIRRAPGVDTSLYIAYPISGAGQHEPSETNVSVLGLDGREVASTTLELQPHGCWVGTLSDLFTVEELEPLAGGDAVVRIRDTGARLYGYTFAETEGAATVPICHLIGG